MKNYSVIIPAHNEANFLEGLLQSLCKQSVQASEIVLVNDNSTDQTEALMERFAKEHKNIHYVNHPSTDQHLPGAKVIKAFSFGLKNLKQPFEVIVKLDADLILPNNYFEELLPVFENPKIGIAGGFCYEEKANGQWKRNHPMGHDHVRGAFKAYSKECFSAIGGLRQAMGWDTIDELLARFFDFETLTLARLKVKHLRPLGAGYSLQAAQLQGAAFYSMRYGLLLSVLASLKSALTQKSIWTFFQLINGFQRAKQEQTPFLITPEQGKFIRNYRWNKIWNKTSH
ncbi:MAG: glycosyltransferase [Flavobacteriaceae bacterium]|nr:glycosyltransferase [Flavobacteriaceae bacterium]MDO7602551.1 glycosyltransferase [Flavobacteriaceae bacterium]